MFETAMLTESAFACGVVYAVFGFIIDGMCTPLLKCVIEAAVVAKATFAQSKVIYALGCLAASFKTIKKKKNGRKNTLIHFSSSGCFGLSLNFFS